MGIKFREFFTIAIKRVIEDPRNQLPQFLRFLSFLHLFFLYFVERRKGHQIKKFVTEFSILIDCPFYSFLNL